MGPDSRCSITGFLRYEHGCVAMCGAAVLALEILGTRMLAPFYGASLYLWTALIVVTLGALSVGYIIGGHWADQGATRRRLALLPLAAGVWLLLIPWIRRPILMAADPLGIRGAVLVAALLLFFLPLLLLGMVSPYAIRLRVRTVGEVGRVAGNLYALSTLASVMAAVLVGFYLIPWIGAQRLTLGLGVMLIAIGTLGLGRRGGGLTAMVLLLGGFVAGVHGDLQRQVDTSEVPWVRESPYGEIRVIDHRGARFLLIDGSVHTMVDAETLEPLIPYVNAVDLGRRFFEEPGRLLLIGLGGGAVAQRYARAGWDVVSVELDRVVIDTAPRFFGMLPTDGPVVCMDGRRFLRDCTDLYHILVLDAFGSSSIPFHLVTEEVFGLAKRLLVPDGVVLANVESVGWAHPMVRALATTLRRHFTTVIALPTMEPPTALGNVVLCASNRPLDLPEELPVPESRFSDAYDRAHAWDNRFAPDAGRVLSDDRNPVDLWAEEVNLEARKQLHSYFGSSVQTW